MAPKTYTAQLVPVDGNWAGADIPTDNKKLKAEPIIAIADPIELMPAPMTIALGRSNVPRGSLPPEARRCVPRQQLFLQFSAETGRCTLEIGPDSKLISRIYRPGGHPPIFIGDDPRAQRTAELEHLDTLWVVAMGPQHTAGGLKLLVSPPPPLASSSSLRNSGKRISLSLRALKAIRDRSSRFRSGGRARPSSAGSAVPGGGSLDDDAGVLALLTEARASSELLQRFDEHELATLARHMTVVPFAAGEEIVKQGEPATFFGLVLHGTIAPVLNGEVQTQMQSAVGTPMGEMSLFGGGHRLCSVVGLTSAKLGVLPFAELERLRKAPATGTVGAKLCTELARVVARRQLENEGRPSSGDVSGPVAELMRRMSVLKWDDPQGGGGGAGGGGVEPKEGLLKKAKAKAREKRQQAKELKREMSAAMRGGSAQALHGKDMSDVSVPEAVKLLIGLRALMPPTIFSDFDDAELAHLAKEVAVLRFRAGETILVEGEPACFFGAVLDGALVPVVFGSVKTDATRGKGALIGELSLFAGGMRGASVVAMTNGSIAVFLYSQLEKLRTTQPALFEKLSHKLARVALSTQLSNGGTTLESLSEADLNEALDELLEKMRAQDWAAQDKRGVENLLKVARHKVEKKVVSYAKEKLDLDGEPAAGRGEKAERSTRLLSDVDAEQAIEMLRTARPLSPVLRPLSDEELQLLARNCAVLRFRVGDAILWEGEAASFFGIVLDGALAPVLNQSVQRDMQRGEGELIGEMALFTGGRRGCSVVATAKGYLAAFPFSELTRLRKAAKLSALSSAQLETSLGARITTELARLVLSVRLAQRGMSLEDVTPREVETALNELLQREAAMKWDEREKAQGDGGGESLLRQAKGAMAKKVRAKVDTALGAIPGSVSAAAIGARKGDVDEDEAMRMLTMAQRSSPIFAQLDAAELRALAQEVTVLNFRQNETILKVGEDVAAHCYTLGEIKHPHTESPSTPSPLHSRSPQSLTPLTPLHPCTPAPLHPCTPAPLHPLPRSAPHTSAPLTLTLTCPPPLLHSQRSASLPPSSALCCGARSRPSSTARRESTCSARTASWWARWRSLRVARARARLWRRAAAIWRHSSSQC